MVEFRLGDKAMKKIKITKIIALALIMTMLCSITAFADSHEWRFDFQQMVIKLAPGDCFKDFKVKLDTDYRDSYSVYLVGNTSKKTYVWGDFKTGSSKLDIYIGEDEQAKRISMYFYLDDTDMWDCIDINIVDPINSDIPETRVKAFKEAKKASETKPVASSTLKTMSDGTLFDPVYYAQKNKDVVKAVGTDEKKLYKHYKKYGKKEGRLPYEGAPVAGK